MDSPYLRLISLSLYSYTTRKLLLLLLLLLFFFYILLKGIQKTV